MSERTVTRTIPFDHALRGRFNAWFFSALDAYINRVTAPLKRTAFGSLAARTVVELGAGVGSNLRYLPPGAELVAVEPNSRMHAALAKRCAQAGVELRLITEYAERIPLADESVDEVICSLVLCTVADPDAVLREVRRVLRPGGRFRFVEHVAGPPRSIRSWVQRAVRRPWGWTFEGCDPHRDTAAVIERAGFQRTSVSDRILRGSVFYPVNTAICGIAWR
ncbi:class I SAM-dependent methyltransferase [Agromyces intestinalis]|uniref:Class I SAM-dependent methyltransferase n=1 Tax=Agromyces intestinalis TaxID=2592652 RepID=A0A5C1YBU4_9MICO|nr:class I SAM-dependent methyltransferase [Agromyces intestinalis]QEO13090.1 class I SAM-dependent methyltransferase [Agromyces intestinalis]